MKRITTVLILVTVIALAVSAGTACKGGGEQKAVSTPETSDIFSSVVSATGEVVPARRATLSGEIAGRVRAIAVGEGDTVESGQTLLQLDAVDLEQAVAQAEAALSMAQAQLARVKAGARPEEIASAEGAVAGAQAQLAIAQANLAAAQAELARLQAGARPEEIAIAEIGVARAQTAKDMAERVYELVANRPGAEVSEAAFNAKLAAHDLDLAKAQLALLKAGATAQELALAQAKVKAAEAQVQSAQAAVSQAQAQLDLLKAGASEQDVAVAEAQVAQAQAALDAAKAALGKATLVAPFAGTVGAVYVREGEMVTPGQPLITLGDLNTLWVETTDLDEAQVTRVAVGQAVTVTFDAIPERAFTGHVTRVAPMAASDAGGVNYTVVVELDQIDPKIRWEMTAFVDIEVGH
ncbi:MAG: efflux RND transporter periplasmic adaptor subunit [Anaerolineae bacterium]|jgi:HlyD family secretion protein|nr:efflux RND transporter periplasmic adaptor subunit [Anaerolineae bacterium]MDH7474805.1 efflux RND transporter periplasmic adaptor subunit [Anaerolineae bacterium]